MTNMREQFTQTVLDVADEYPIGYSDLRAFAEHLLNELLPEITDAVLLPRLPEGSVLLGENGKSWVRTPNPTQPWLSANGGGYGSSTGDLTEITDRMFRNEGPFTLVWVP